MKTLFVNSEVKNPGKTTAVITKIDHRTITLGECPLGGNELAKDLWERL
jgi:hypothetical protein